jgi:hypothetical protein
MAIDYAAFVSFSAKDQISGVVDKARKNTEAGSKRMSESFAGAGRSADTLKEKIRGIGKIAGGVAIGALIAKGLQVGIRAVKNFVSSVGEYTARADEIRVSAMKIGMSAENFQRLSYAAASSNVDVGKLTTGFNTLNKSLGEMSRGQGALYKYLETTNRSLLSQVKNCKSNVQVFKTLADALKKETDITKKASLGTAAFGRQWAELLPLLSQGAEGIEKLGDNIPNLISDRNLAMASLWRSNLAEIKRHIQGFGDILRSAVIRHVGVYVLMLKDCITTNRELIATKINEFVVKFVNFVKAAIPVVISFFNFIKKLVITVYHFRKEIIAIGATIKVLQALVTGAKAVNSAMLLLKGTTAATGGGMFASLSKLPQLFARIATAIGGVTLGVVGLFAASLIGIQMLINKKYEALNNAVAKEYGLDREEMAEVRNTANERIATHNTNVTRMEDLLATNRQLRERALAFEGEDAAAKYNHTISQTELWLKANPRIQPDDDSLFEELRKDAALKKAQKDENDPMKKLEEELAKLNGNFEDYMSDFNIFADSTSPAQLRWKNMGYDFYETMRLGV